MVGLRTQVTAAAIQVWDGSRGRVKELCSAHRVVAAQSEAHRGMSVNTCTPVCFIWSTLGHEGTGMTKELEHGSV